MWGNIQSTVIFSTVQVELFHPWARKSFYWMHGRRQKVFEKIQGIRNLVLAECGLH
jgi:hypothetical protein